MTSLPSSASDARLPKRPSRPGEPDTGYHWPIRSDDTRRESGWTKAALSVGILFALAVALASMVAR